MKYAVANQIADARSQALKEDVLAHCSPTHHDIVCFQLRKKDRNVFRIILKISVQGYNDLPACGFEPGTERRGLP